MALQIFLRFFPTKDPCHPRRVSTMVDSTQERPNKEEQLLNGPCLGIVKENAVNEFLFDFTWKASID